jgi:hypothetical protein
MKEMWETLGRNCGGVTQLLYIIQNIDSQEILCRAFRQLLVILLTCK